MISTLQGIILGAILALFLGLGVTIFIQHERLKTQQTRIEAMLVDNAALLSENNRWKNISTQQNAKIAAQINAQTANDMAARKAVSAAEAKAKRYAAIARKITAAKNTQDDCAAASDIKNLFLKNRP